jgi:hypothetical protein
LPAFEAYSGPRNEQSVKKCAVFISAEADQSQVWQALGSLILYNRGFSSATACCRGVVLS